MAVMYNSFSSMRSVTTFPQGVLPYMGYIGMCHCEGYGFQAVYSRIGYIKKIYFRWTTSGTFFFSSCVVVTNTYVSRAGQSGAKFVVQGNNVMAFLFADAAM